MALREIDSLRVDGKFVDADGETPAEGQYVRGRISHVRGDLVLRGHWLIVLHPSSRDFSSSCEDAMVSSTG